MVLKGCDFVYRLKLKILEMADSVNWVNIDDIFKNINMPKKTVFLAMDELGVAGYIEQRGCKYIRTTHFCSTNLFKKRHREKQFAVVSTIIAVVIALVALLWDVVGFPPLLDSSQSVCDCCVSDDVSV